MFLIKWYSYPALCSWKIFDRSLKVQYHPFWFICNHFAKSCKVRGKYVSSSFSCGIIYSSFISVYVTYITFPYIVGLFCKKYGGCRWIYTGKGLLQRKIPHLYPPATAVAYYLIYHRRKGGRNRGASTPLAWSQEGFGFGR